MVGKEGPWRDKTEDGCWLYKTKNNFDSISCSEVLLLLPQLLNNHRRSIYQWVAKMSCVTQSVDCRSPQRNQHSVLKGFYGIAIKKMNFSITKTIKRRPRSFYFSASKRKRRCLGWVDQRALEHNNKKLITALNRRKIANIKPSTKLSISWSWAGDFRSRKPITTPLRKWVTSQTGWISEVQVFRRVEL